MAACRARARQGLGRAAEEHLPGPWRGDAPRARDLRRRPRQRGRARHRGDAGADAHRPLQGLSASRRMVRGVPLVSPRGRQGREAPRRPDGRHALRPDDEAIRAQLRRGQPSAAAGGAATKKAHDMAQAGITDLHRAATRHFFPLSFEQQLAYLCNKWEVKPLGYFEDRRGRIYVAEGWFAKRPEDGLPGWPAPWALRPTGPCLGQPLYIAASAPPDPRPQVALSPAVSFMDEEDGEKARAAG